MPVKHKPGKKIRDYTIDRWINTGAMAISYQASQRGKKYFFKQYKSPTPSAEWFQDYTIYSQEVKDRIQRDHGARSRCYEMVEFFEEKDFFQVFEFVEGGRSLTDVLNQREKEDFKKLVIFAKVFVNAVAAIHNVGVIHTDLKPDNVYLIPDSEIEAGFLLRLIDLDFAILHDKTAPWVAAKHMGYIGSDGYRSPEHLRGETPSRASDVFTCGIILTQILCGYHPLGDGISEIEGSTLEGRARPFQLPQPIGAVEDVGFLVGVVNSCLCPDAGRRPTAKQVADALLGKVFNWEPWVPAALPTRPSTPEKAPEPAADGDPIPTATRPPVASCLKIFLEDKEVLSARVDTRVGKNVLIRAHEDAKYLGNPQFHLKRTAEGWTIGHDPGAVNKTLVNGKAFDSPIPIEDGMVVTVGNPATGNSKLPLTLRLVT